MVDLAARDARGHDAARAAALGAEGLLAPSRIAAGGRRWYDERGLVRLQRILLLRGLGIAVGDIAPMLDGGVDEVEALRTHLEQLRGEQARATRRIAAVVATIGRLERGEPLMAEESFDGFAPEEHRDEVVQRWGEPAYETGARWWRESGADARTAFHAEQDAIAAGWITLADAGADARSAEAQDLADRHLAWLGAVPGLPRTADGRLAAEYVRGVAAMYVDHERFAAVYGGPARAALVRDALTAAVGGPVSGSAAGGSRRG